MIRFAKQTAARKAEGKPGKRKAPKPRKAKSSALERIAQQQASRFAGDVRG